MLAKCFSCYPHHLQNGKKHNNKPEFFHRAKTPPKYWWQDTAKSVLITNLFFFPHEYKLKFDVQDYGLVTVFALEYAYT